MNDVFQGYVAAGLVAALACAIVAIFGLRRGHVPGIHCFIVMMLGASVWCAAFSAELLVPTLAAKVTCERILYIGPVLIAPCWLLFALAYTGRVWRSRLLPVCLFILPAVTLAISWSPLRSQLMWKAALVAEDGSQRILGFTWGPWFWFHVTFSYGCMVIGAVLVLTAVLGDVRRLTPQAVTLVVAVTLPVLVNALGVMGLLAMDGLDPAPLAIAASGLLMAFGLSRLDVLDAYPGIVRAARNAVTRELRDGVLVLDAHGCVLSVNRAAARMLPAA